MTDAPKQKLPSDQKVGAFFSVVFLIAGAYSYRTVAGSTLPALFGVLALAVGVIAILAPRLLNPFNRLWFKLGLLLGKVVSPIVLGVIFFVIIVPIAAMTRAFGRDVLMMRRSPTDSYWIKREAPRPLPESFKNQF